MKHFAVFLVVSGLTALAIAGVVTAETDRQALTTVTPKQLVAGGWDCLDPGYWVHCTPPGIDIGKAPPVIVALNFYTRDPKAAHARFLGFEDLIRADLWKALRRHWPCGATGVYKRVPGNSLPPPGYLYCHHFNDRLPLPK